MRYCIYISSCLSLISFFTVIHKNLNTAAGTLGLRCMPLTSPVSQVVRRRQIADPASLWLLLWHDRNRLQSHREEKCLGRSSLPPFHLPWAPQHPHQPLSADSSLWCYMSMRPSVSLPVISCTLGLLKLAHTVIMFGFFYFLFFKYDVCATLESRLPPGMACIFSAWRGAQRWATLHVDVLLTDCGWTWCWLAADGSSGRGLWDYMANPESLPVLQVSSWTTWVPSSQRG